MPGPRPPERFANSSTQTSLSFDMKTLNRKDRRATEVAPNRPGQENTFRERLGAPSRPRPGDLRADRLASQEAPARPAGRTSPHPATETEGGHADKSRHGEPNKSLKSVASAAAS